MSINWKDTDEIYKVFSDICDVIEQTNQYEEGADACEQLDSLLSEYFDNIPDETALDTEFLKRMINRSGMLYLMVPMERFWEKELFLLLLKANPWKKFERKFGTIFSSTEDGEVFLKVAPEELTGDKDFVLKGLQLKPTIYEYISDQLKSDEDVLNLALELDWRSIHHIPRNVHIQRDIAVKAVSKDGWNIGNIPHEYDRDLDLLYTAVRENPHSFREASEFFRKDVDLTIKLIKEEDVPLNEADDCMWENPCFVTEMLKMFGIKVLNNIDWGKEDFTDLSFIEEITRINPSSVSCIPDFIKLNPAVEKIMNDSAEKIQKEALIKTEEEHELDLRWDEFLRRLYVHHTMFVSEFQELFFDTFWYFRNRPDVYVLNAGGWHILSCLCALRKIPMDFVPEGCLLNEFNAARCLSEDLLSEINGGMQGYYTEDNFVILRGCVPPAGCSEFSANMETFQSFCWDFEEVVRTFDECFEGWRGEYYSGRYNIPGYI